jgi:glycosyltransferase involved in cell wall biosynthesis
MRRQEATPIVSVVTPLYNSAAHIGGVLERLRAQTFTDWEAVLVDDGSTDDTPDRVKPFLEDPRFRYLRQRNQGTPAARNTAIREARGRWIALLDHDDLWMETKLERQLELADRSGCEIICANAFVVTPTSKRVYSDYFPDDVRAAVARWNEPGTDLFAHLIRMNFLCSSSVLVRRSLIVERGFFDPGAWPADDYDMWLRCLPDARIAYLPEPLVEYVWHESNFSLDSVTMRKAAIYVLRKTRRRCSGDRSRVEQCDSSLTVHYAVLFQELILGRRLASVLLNALRLGAEGRTGPRLLARAWRMRNEVRAGF